MRMLNVMPTRNQRLASIVLLALTLQACGSMNLRDFCSGSELTPPEPDSLGVILGVAPHRLNESPFIILNSPTQANPQQALNLKLEPMPVTWPAGLDESPCPSMDWRTYRLVVSADEWDAFWNQPRPLSYEIGIGVFEYVVPMRESEFALALIDRRTGDVLMRCGCYGA